MCIFAVRGDEKTKSYPRSEIEIPPLGGDALYTPPFLFLGPIFGKFSKSFTHVLESVY